MHEQTHSDLKLAQLLSNSPALPEAAKLRKESQGSRSVLWKFLPVFLLLKQPWKHFSKSVFPLHSPTSSLSSSTTFLCPEFPSARGEKQVQRPELIGAALLSSFVSFFDRQLEMSSEGEARAGIWKVRVFFSVRLVRGLRVHYNYHGWESENT